LILKPGAAAGVFGNRSDGVLCGQENPMDKIVMASPLDDYKIEINKFPASPMQPTSYHRRLMGTLMTKQKLLLG
jgi:hypothetical protein